MTSETSEASGIMLKPLGGGEPIEIQGEMIIGRGSASDLVIDEDRLSRKHARLSVGDRAVLVEDLGSTNGTSVNDQKVDAPVLAKNGDIIKFDSFGYEVVVIGGIDVTDTTVTGDAIPEEEVLEAKTQVFTPPKSWALDDNKSSEGTQVMSLDMLQKNADEDDGLDVAEDITSDVPILVCTTGDLKGKIFKFNTRDKLTKWEIGRADNCEIKIDDGSVSTNHAQLVHEGRRWKLIDLMSANGTYVNGNKGLTSYLSSGDKVRFGQVEFVFKLSGAEVTGPMKKPTASSKKENASGGVPTWVLAAGAFVVTAAVLYFLLG